MTDQNKIFSSGTATFDFIGADSESVSMFTQHVRNAATRYNPNSSMSIERATLEILLFYILKKDWDKAHALTVELSQTSIKSPQIIEFSNDDDWTLNPDQMFFMFEHHNLIANAYANEDMKKLSELASTEAYKTIFGSMSFDEAYDRYETMLEGEGGDS
jgi:hypothetical protein